MEKKQIRIGSLYIKGVAINFAIVVVTSLFKITIFGDGENFFALFYIIFFLLSFLFYLPFLGFNVYKNRLNIKKRYIITLTPTFLYILLTICFYLYFGELKILLALSPCIILNLLYSLIVESWVTNSIE